MYEAATEWNFKDFLEQLKENMKPEIMKKIKHHIGGNNEIDSILITMNR